MDIGDAMIEQATGTIIFFQGGHTSYVKDHSPEKVRQAMLCGYPSEGWTEVLGEGRIFRVEAVVALIAG